MTHLPGVESYATGSVKTSDLQKKQLVANKDAQRDLK